VESELTENYVGDGVATVWDAGGGHHAVRVVRIGRGLLALRVVEYPAPFLMVMEPTQVSVVSNGFVYMVDTAIGCVTELTPELTVRRVMGKGVLDGPVGVCANDDVIVVSENAASRVTVLRCCDGSVVTHFGTSSRGDGRRCVLENPCGLCFMYGGTHVAIAEYSTTRVSVFDLHGAFVRHVGDGVLSNAEGVACSAFNELVVADTANSCIHVFSDVGELLLTFGAHSCSSVALHGNTLVATSYVLQMCAVYT
jgi:hypothetical protein